MQIQSAAIIGMGAMGVMYAEHIAAARGDGAVAFIADADRIARYRASEILVNGQPKSFLFLDPVQDAKPIDLLIFAVKYGAMQDAVRLAAPFVGPDTLILSVLNGIASEQDLINAFGAEHVLYCVGQGMDCGKDGFVYTYQNMGYLYVGEPDNSRTQRLLTVVEYLNASGVPARIPDNTLHAMWNKLMLNTGVNQTCCVYNCGYRGIQCNGPARQTVLAAMKEVQAMANAQNIPLTDGDIAAWMDLMDSLNPDGAPSMVQDRRARRKTEVALFGGTICRLGRELGIPTPVNDGLTANIAALEATF